MNKMAIETHNKAAWFYDMEMWNDLADKVKKKQADVDIKGQFLKVSEDEKTRIKNLLEVKGKGKSKHKDNRHEHDQQRSGGKDGGKWSSRNGGNGSDWRGNSGKGNWK